MNDLTHGHLAALTDAPAEPGTIEYGRERRRAARVLIGWMHRNDAIAMLARPHGSRRDPDIIRRVAEAQRLVAERIGTFDAEGAIADLPAELDDYAAALVARPEFAVYRRHGWQLKLADMRKVCAVQEVVHLDHAVRRFEDVDPDDLLALAKLCLPTKTETGAVRVQWSEKENHWMLSSDNPNLSIVAHFSEPQDLGGGRIVPTYGFSVEAQPSFVQVARHRGRYILRDGYHRSLALAARGARYLPVVYREFGEFESLNLTHGNLSEQTYLGHAPATIFDYLDDDVSAYTTMSIKKSVIIIEAKNYTLTI